MNKKLAPSRHFSIQGLVGNKLSKGFMNMIPGLRICYNLYFHCALVKKNDWLIDWSSDFDGLSFL